MSGDTDGDRHGMRCAGAGLWGAGGWKVGWDDNSGGGEWCVLGYGEKQGRGEGMPSAS